MNMVEVAYQLRESVNVIVGSEIEEPFDGWPYAEILTRLTALKTGKGRAIIRQGKIGREVRGTCGLSIYFPGDRINSAYRNLEFSGDCKWITFLERHLS